MSLAWKGLVPLGLGLILLTGGLVYVQKPVSFLAPVGNLVLLAVALVVMGLSRRPVMGRQDHLPPVGPGGQAARM